MSRSHATVRRERAAVSGALLCIGSTRRVSVPALPADPPEAECSRSAGHPGPVPAEKRPYDFGAVLRLLHLLQGMTAAEVREF